MIPRRTHFTLCSHAPLPASSIWYTGRPCERAKREFLDEWVRAVNAQGGFGQWAWDVSWLPADIKDLLKKCNTGKGKP
jgi:hypothetical protein